MQNITPRLSRIMTATNACTCFSGRFVKNHSLLNHNFYNCGTAFKTVALLCYNNKVLTSSCKLYIELCAGLAASPPQTICVRRRRLLLIGTPPPIICRRAADTTVAVQLFLGIFDDFFFKFSALWQVQTSNGFMFLDVELLL